MNLIKLYRKRDVLLDTYFCYQKGNMRSKHVNMRIFYVRTKEVLKKITCKKKRALGLKLGIYFYIRLYVILLKFLFPVAPSMANARACSFPRDFPDLFILYFFQ